MRAIFFLIGLIFDAVILVASGGLVYMYFQPGLLDLAAGFLGQKLATPRGGLELLAVGAVFFLLAFRGLFLLLFREHIPEVVVADQPTGRVALSHAALQSVLRRLVSISHPGASLRHARAHLSPEGLDIEIRVDLDLVDTNLGDYARDIEALVREHFKQKLGLDIRAFNIQAGDAAAFTPGIQGA